MKNLLTILLLIPVLSTGQGDYPIYTRSDLMGKFEAAGHPDFVRVAPAYASHQGHFLRKEVYAAFLRMAEHAKRDGIQLVVVSAARSFFRQKTIWNNKYDRYSGTDLERAKQILRYSSMPGTSRHHWGTDFDINSVEPAFFESGEGKRIYEWMQNHAGDYGFFQPYQKFTFSRDKGYYEEKWHWSYYPTASRFQRAYAFLINYDDIEGFKGARAARELDVIETYVQCIAR